MAIQVNRGFRNRLGVDAMIESYECAQKVLSEAGYREYCFNYFSKDDKNRFDAGLYGYQLDGDIMGFGAGATSTLGGMSLFNPDTELHKFMENPCSFSSIRNYSLDQPEMFFPLLGGALMTKQGLSFEKFEYITGVPLAAALQTPQVKAWFRYVEICGARLVYERHRIVSADGNIHRVYLKNLAYTLNPALAQLA